MKTTLYPLLVLLISLQIVTSCDKLPANGDLEGFWQVTGISLHNGEGFGEEVSVKHTKMFWTFQQDLLSIITPDNPNLFERELLSRFSHQGNKLDLTQMYIHLRAEDIPITQEMLDGQVPEYPLNIKQYGLNAPTTAFTIRTLNADAMVLESSYARIRLRKF